MLVDLEDVKFNQIKYQVITILGANTITFCHGFAVGWTSSALATLLSKDTPLKNGPLTVEQKMWLVGVYSIGALLGDVIFLVLIKYLGRKTSMLLTGFPSLVFWIIILTATSFELLLIGRLIGGMSVGGLLVCIPVFVTEISNKQVRGLLGMINPLAVALGVLMSYICGGFIQYQYVPYFIIGFPILYTIVTFLTPDTPHSLIRKRKMEKAERALIFYNNGNSYGNGYDVAAEMKKLETLVAQTEEDKTQHSYLQLILQKESLKQLLIGASLVFLSIFSGSLVMNMYCSRLFESSGASFDSNVSAIIVGVVQVCGIVVSSILVDKLGRRFLFGFSSFWAAIFMICFGTFSYLNRKGVDVTNLYWVPVVSASLFIFTNSVGMRPMPFLYVAEILPRNVRQIGVTICMLLLSFFSFITVYTLPFLEELCGLHTVLWIYGGICILGTFFSIFVMSETKGKNVNQIRDK